MLSQSYIAYIIYLLVYSNYYICTHVRVSCSLANNNNNKYRQPHGFECNCMAIGQSVIARGEGECNLNFFFQIGLKLCGYLLIIGHLANN